MLVIRLEPARETAIAFSATIAVTVPQHFAFQDSQKYRAEPSAAPVARGNQKTNMRKILFICVHNSARSQMAEAWLKYTCGDTFVSESAGLERGKLNPLAVQVMSEVGIDISKKKTQEILDVFRSGKLFAYVITVSTRPARKNAPSSPV